MVDIIVERLEQLDSLVLKYGSHASFEEGVCAMEAVAWLAGEEHTDAPQCACPVIAAVVRSFNDALPTDDERTRLIRPLLTKIVGTRKEGTPAERASVLLKRMYMVYDWYMRVRAPAFLRLAGLEKEAASLQACLPVVDDASLRATEEAARAAESVARSVARNAERNAAKNAAKNAVRNAVEYAVKSAAKSVPWSVPWSAARSVIESVAESAAESVARNAAANVAWSAARSVIESVAERAAESVAGSAAKSAVENAAKSAARSAAERAAKSAAWGVAERAAWSALEPTVKELQSSFADLIARMCEVTE